jgi:hypothetical protein
MADDGPMVREFGPGGSAQGCGPGGLQSSNIDPIKLQKREIGRKSSGIAAVECLVDLEHSKLLFKKESAFVPPVIKITCNQHGGVGWDV